MLARIADSLFWIGRYMERAEDTARMLDVHYYTLVERQGSSQRLRWEPIIRIAGEQDRFYQFHTEADAESVFHYLAFSPGNPNSIRECVERVRENARTIREIISREMWEDINGFYHEMKNFQPEEELRGGPHRFCRRVIFACHRFSGVSDGTLLHDEGWQFMRIGKFLERAEMTARIVNVQYHNLVDKEGIEDADDHQWMAVLKSAGAYQAYRRWHRSRVVPPRVAEMLILHPDHPRSVRFCFTQLQLALRDISGTMPGDYANEAERLTGKVLESLRYHRMEEIFKEGLEGYLVRLQASCREIGHQIARRYFYYTAA
ncbi:MAG: alpha-E domain-containing protein [Acidimicrobiia bacterium]|nr:alpha-E domain-containing protein [Acidimicrobiia bacterium]